MAAFYLVPDTLYRLRIVAGITTGIIFFGLIICSVVVLMENPCPQTNLQYMSSDYKSLNHKVSKIFQGLRILQTACYYDCVVNKFSHYHHAWGFNEEWLTYWYQILLISKLTILRCKPVLSLRKVFVLKGPIYKPLFSSSDFKSLSPRSSDHKSLSSSLKSLIKSLVVCFCFCVFVYLSCYVFSFAPAKL